MKKLTLGALRKLIKEETEAGNPLASMASRLKTISNNLYQISQQGSLDEEDAMLIDDTCGELEEMAALMTNMSSNGSIRIISSLKH